MSDDHGTDEEPDIAPHLEALGKTLTQRGFGKTLTQRGFRAPIVWPGDEPPFVRITNPGAGQLAEDVRCASIDGELWFLWSWRRLIAPVVHLELAADQIAHVLTPK